VSRVLPTNVVPKDTARPLGYKSKKHFPIVPALNFKLRGSQLPLPKSQDMIACLHLEVTPHAACDIRIDEVILKYPDGEATLINGPIPIKMPLTLQSMDEIMFLFSLKPSYASQRKAPTATSSVKQITVKLRGEAMVSDSCRPVISTHWETTIDFSTGSHQLPTHPGHNVQRSLRPPPQIGNTVDQSENKVPQYQPQSTAAEASGLSITFTGSNRVHIGEIFSWQVFVVNRSAKHRKLALIVPPRRRKGEGKTLPSIPQNITEAVLDDAALHNIYRAQNMEPTDLISLVNDVKIG